MAGAYEWSWRRRGVHEPGAQGRSIINGPACPSARRGGAATQAAGGRGGIVPRECAELIAEKWP